jgi:hypothetical protein
VQATADKPTIGARPLLPVGLFLDVMRLTSSANKATLESDLSPREIPTRTEGLNMRGIFSFPIERYAAIRCHPGAQEIAAWLRGEYTFDPQCLTT